MRNSLKVGKWEVKKNLKNKSFLISLFLTPLIILIFAIVPSLLSDPEPEITKVFIMDELNVYSAIEVIVEEADYLEWEVEETTLSIEKMKQKIKETENSAFILLTEKAVDEGIVPVYFHDEVKDSFMNEIYVLEGILQERRLANLDLTQEQLEAITRGVVFDFQQTEMGLSEETGAFSSSPFPEDEEQFFKQIVPGVFAGIVLFSIIISGMMIFQSASQEKKDKIAEIILSSVTANELMQGKIIGYFALGLIQVTVWIGIGLPIALWKIDLPLLEYLLVPELGILLFIAILGYLLFASIFIGLGATMEDTTSTGNFQSVVLMLPFLPFLLIGPILTDPTGTLAKISTFIPFTSPGVLLLRLSFLEEWPWTEIIIGIILLILSIWIFMKLAGKIFKTGILLYGKNATPKEIWRWLRA